MAAWCEARMLKVAVIGAGWAGCAAAVQATRLGHDVTLYESSRIPGGRARRVDITHHGKAMTLDNGQHILIGAYSETLRLIADLGVDADAAMLRIPLTMKFPDGSGLQLPRLPAPLDALLGIAYFLLMPKTLPNFSDRVDLYHWLHQPLNQALNQRLQQQECGPFAPPSF